MNPFEAFLIHPILNLLIALYQALNFLHIPGSLGFAIILLTSVIRIALWPLTTSQLKSTQKMAALKPHLSRIKEEHGHDKVRHQQEVSSLYKQHGVNPVAGCLPLILQIPIFISLYQVLFRVVDFGGQDFITRINDQLYFPALYLKTMPSTNFLGFSLAAKPSDWANIGFLILLIPIATGLLQFIQSKMLMPASPNQNQAAVAKAKKDDKKAAEGEPRPKERGDLEDAMSSMQSQMSLIMPAMIAFFSYGFPVGLSLYWNTFTVFGIIQQYLIVGAGSFNKYLPKKWQR